MSCLTRTLDAKAAIDAYMEAAVLWPKPDGRQRQARRVHSLLAIAENYDCLVLDGFGVLNVGREAVPGMAEAVATLQRAGKIVVVLTNGATVPTSTRPEHYTRLGYTFALEHIISSRDAFNRAVGAKQSQWLWGTATAAGADLTEIPVATLALADDPADYARVDAFLLLSSDTWTQHRQGLLESALKACMRPVYVANPDLVAPYNDVQVPQPGYYACLAHQRTGVRPRFFGKPFAQVYDMTWERLVELGYQGSPTRVLMVGDTPFTDVLGGNNAGLHTALMADYGLCRTLALDPLFARCGIWPDWVITRRT